MGPMSISIVHIYIVLQSYLDEWIRWPLRVVVKYIGGGRVCIIAWVACSLA